MGATFRSRLESLVEQAGSVKAFASRLRQSSASKTDYSPRVAEWRSGRNMPKSDSLWLIAKTFDISTDWLLGFKVPSQRSAREPVGDLRRLLEGEIARREDLDAADLSLVTEHMPMGEPLVGWLTDVVVREHALLINESRASRLRAHLDAYRQRSVAASGARSPIARALLKPELNEKSIGHLTTRIETQSRSPGQRGIVRLRGRADSR